MIFVEMTEAPASVKGWVARARKVPVVLTIKGRPVAAVTPLDEGDWERLVVSCRRAFRERRRAGARALPRGSGHLDRGDAEAAEAPVGPLRPRGRRATGARRARRGTDGP